MREAIKQALSLRNIDVNKEDYPYVELQVHLIQQLEGKLANSKLKDIVPVTVYRAEVAKE
ncbi:hypothetical protein [Pueribacillus sp. YX66]|uniref:hypothetical protein n=1 Tax=Pueribacillus sp. YX66 TaxID=3229242 RepID=UPI00358CF5D3